MADDGTTQDNTDGGNDDQTLLSDTGDAGSTDDGASTDTGDQKSKSLLDGDNGNDDGNASTDSNDGSSDDTGSDDGDAGNDDDQSSKPKAPEVYADFELPEGVEITPERLERATSVFKDLGLSQDQAQAIVSLQAEDVRRQQQEANELIEGWIQEATSHPDFKTRQANASALLSQFGNEATKMHIAESPIGNNPQIIEFLANVYKAVNDTGIRDGQQGGADGGPRTAADIMYDGMEK